MVDHYARIEDQVKDETMFSRDPINVHYERLLDTAEAVLAGPLSVRVDTDFWGSPNLVLRRETMPKIEGTIESRILYANLCDDEQKEAILRHASWDARTARESIRKRLGDSRGPSAIHPILLVHFVWTDVNWLRQSIGRLEELTIPLKVPRVDPLFRTMYRLRIERNDRTITEASWGKNMPGDYQILSEMWESIWQQMTDFLQNSGAARPEELWKSGSAPIYEKLNTKA
jgi:hypothetical protein